MSWVFFFQAAAMYLTSVTFLVQIPDSFTLMFDAADTLLSGRTNCNRIFGKYVHEGDKLDMGNLGMTRMACPDMQYEIRFTKMLSEVDRYEISGSTLKLYEGDKLLAEFRPVVEAEKK